MARSGSSGRLCLRYHLMPKGVEHRKNFGNCGGHRLRYHLMPKGVEHQYTILGPEWQNYCDTI